MHVLYILFVFIQSVESPMFTIRHTYIYESITSRRFTHLDFDQKFIQINRLSKFKFVQFMYTANIWNFHQISNDFRRFLIELHLQYKLRKLNSCLKQSSHIFKRKTFFCFFLSLSLFVLICRAMWSTIPINFASIPINFAYLFCFFVAVCCYFVFVD